MYELIQLSEHDYYVNCPAKIGIVCLNDTDVVLIDSGNDKDAGKKVRKILDEKGWRLSAIFNTHSHADHIGGNAYLAEQTGCAIYARGIEQAFTAHPILEPSFLYGACPVKELCGKFLLAKESNALPLTEEVLPDGFSLLPLPGHSFDMVGFQTPDGNFFIADALSSVETLEKYKVGFLYDVAAYIKTLETVNALKGGKIIPSHAPVCEDLSKLASYNIDTTTKIAQDIASLCKAPLSFEELLQKVFETYELTMTIEQYALVGASVKAYLSYLKEQGKVTCRIEDGKLLWESL